MIIVERAPPYLTVQDEGRRGYRTSGVPQCGAMDQWSLAAANRAVGNERNTAALEWAVAGGALRFGQDAVVALAGTRVDATIDGAPIESNAAVSISAGRLLEVRQLVGRRFLYVAVRGGIDCPSILGSRSTYLPGGFGGLGGSMISRGMTIPISSYSDGRPTPARDPAPSAPDYDAETIRVIPASENLLPSESITDNFASGDDAFAAFLDGTYTVSSASDRSGYRLDGGSGLEKLGASITSRPLCPGTIQLPPGGQPIVLMADSPTIGGYKILGNVVSCDLPILAQCMPGRVIRFAAVSAEVGRRTLVDRRT